MSIKHIHFFFLAFLSITFNEAFAFNKFIGYGYCAIRHPVESITSDRPACESQHVVQQQSGGTDQLNTIWINTTLHTYLDRSVCKPWENERPSFAPLSDQNIERAYMIGTWSLGYNYFVYDHHGSGSLTLINWDGSSHLLYMISSIVNLPQKEVNYLAYQIERYRKDQNTQVFDAVAGVLIDIGEVAVGAVYSAVGLVVGTVVNPWDTLRNIPSLITLAISSIFNSIWLLLKGIAALFTAGAIGSCGL